MELSELDLQTPFTHLPNANPLRQLTEMGFGVVPVLTEALDDTTPTRTVTRAWGNVSRVPPKRGGTRVWRVNELAARVILQVCSRNFTTGDRRNTTTLREACFSYPDRVPEFRKPVTAWYAENKGRSLEERMIADLWDPYPGNRGTAGGWLARHKSAAAVPSMTKRLDAIVAAERTDVSSITIGEVAGLCLALADIAGERAYPAVRKGFGYVIRHDSDPNDYGARGAIEAMSRLGHKTEAEAECKRAHEAQERAMRQWKRGPDGSGFDIPGE